MSGAGLHAGAMPALPHEQHINADGIPVRYRFVGIANPDEVQRVAEDFNALVREHNRREANRKLDLLRGPWNGMVIGQILGRRSSVYLRHEHEGWLAIVDTRRYQFWAPGLWNYMRNEISLDAIQRVRLYRGEAH